MFQCNLCAAKFEAQDFISHKRECLLDKIRKLKRAYRDSHWKAHVERVLANMKDEERKPLTSRAKRAEELDWDLKQASSR